MVTVSNVQQKPSSSSDDPEIRPHQEKHFINPRFISDMIIGMSDGLTVPFALTAGLSSTGNKNIIILNGLAELISGSISMGLGGFLAAKSESEHYASELAREQREVIDCPEEEKDEIHAILALYGLTKEAATPFVERLAEHPAQWVDFMMQFELGLQKPETSRLWLSALTIGLSYLLGGIIPLLPYFFVNGPKTHGLLISSLLTGLVLFVFGYAKTFFTVRSARRATFSAVQTLVIGATAAAASYGVVYGLDQKVSLHTSGA